MNQRVGPHTSEGLSDDIVEMEVYEAPMPVVGRPFLPWHRPRKQYVRHHQWCAEIGKLVAATPPAEKVLKYFGLPGVDLLDLRHIHTEICETQNIGLRFLGFNSSANPKSAAHAEMNVSLDEVRRLEFVDQRSDLLGDNFALVANENSIACEKARELGPYDVINLDLCDGFGNAAPGVLENTYYDAVNSLLALQARSTNPWLLFLTTRADQSNINDVVLEALVGKYRQNLDTCAAFRDASREFFAIETAAALALSIETAAGLLPVFLTGLCKWFVALGLAHQPPTSVELCSVFGYRISTTAEHEDLISLALKFTPTYVPANDPLGLAQASGGQPNECVLATRALKKVAKRIDADKKLSDDAALLAKMTDATAALLSLARYDAKAYKAWVQTA